MNTIELTIKIEDSRLRRLAARHCYSLRRGRSLLSADNLGGYMIVDPSLNAVIAGERFNLDAEAVREFFSSE